MQNITQTFQVAFLALLIGGFLNSTLQAQQPNFKFKTINQANGLTNSTVQTIYEDSYGFIWLGTHHGVQRYDGKTYKNYAHTKLDSTGLSDNYINGFCEDANTNIWIATSRGLNLYNRKTDRIEKYEIQNKELTKNGEPATLRLLLDNSNADIMWINVMEYGLVRLNTQNNNIQVFPLRAIDDKWLLWSLHDPNDTSKILLGSENLYSFDKNTGQIEELLQLEQLNETPNNLINDAQIDPVNQEVIWLATGDYWGRGTQGGLTQFNLKTGETIHYTEEDPKAAIPGRHCLSLGFYDKDNLWIGSRNNGAILFDRKEGKFTSFVYNEYDEGSLVTENAVRSILKDRSGTMWFGTWGDGISLLSKAAQKFSHYKHLPGTTDGLSDNSITAFTEDKYGNIWIGTKSGHLSRFNPFHKTFKNFHHEFATSNNNFSQITYLYYDSQDNLWIGTYEDALFRYTPATGTKIHFNKGSAKNEISQKRVSAITEFNPGEILISTYGGGLNIYSYESNDFTQYLHDSADSNSIPDNQIWKPFKGDDGNYYFCGNSITAFFNFNPATKKFQKLKTKNSYTTFQNPTITNDGKIYVDDVAEGLSLLTLSDEAVFNTIYDVDGNSIKNIESILTDSQNNLWIGTGNGLIKYNPKSNTIKKYDADDGLQGYVFTRYAGFKASTGEMYFGGKNGFSVFHPEKIRPSDYNPPIVFTDFQLFQESLPINESSPLKQNILLTEKLILDHDQNDFSIFFAALDYSNPQKIEYQYILEKHDEEWKYADHTGMASYTNMDPGRYTFKVMATNSDGIWNEKEKSIQIMIKPPWWKTTGAYIFYGLILILGIVVVDRVQRRRLVERERAQTREKELVQAKEIEKAYTNLKATQAQLIHSEKMASLGELTAGIAHEIQNPLNFVNNFSDVSVDLIDELTEEVEKGSKENINALTGDLRQNLAKIHHHGERASSIVKGMLEHSRTGNGKKELTDINVLVDEYLRLAYHGLRAKDNSFNAEFKVELDRSLPNIPAVSQDLGRVLLNLINNAFYAVNSKTINNKGDYKPLVVVQTKQTNDKIEIKVRDNGNGIPAEIKDKIFQPFFTTKPTGKGTGLGLSMSYDIITKGHSGVLIVETTVGTGTEFTIMLPVKNKA